MIAAGVVLQIIVAVVGLASIVTGAELFALRSLYRRGGALDAEILGCRELQIARLRLSTPSLLAATQCLLGVGLVVSVWISLLRGVVALLLAAVTLIAFRQVPFGRDGSDDMSLILVPPVAVAWAFQGPFIKIALVFVAAQLMLAYLASGVAKVASPVWRSGRATAAILRTATYGNAGVAGMLVRWRLGRLADWGTIVAECSLPFMFLWGGPTTMVAAVAAVLFHFGIAIVMGLNRFALWFIAAIPAAVWVGDTVRLGTAFR